MQTRLRSRLDLVLTASRPVDVSAREAEVQQKIEKEREEVREKVAHTTMSRTSSRQGSQRPTPPASAMQSPTTPQESHKALPSSNVRPAFSFASAAAGKKDSSESVPKDDVEAITEKIDEVELEASAQ